MCPDISWLQKRHQNVGNAFSYPFNPRDCERLWKAVRQSPETIRCWRVSRLQAGFSKSLSGTVCVCLFFSPAHFQSSLSLFSCASFSLWTCELINTTFDIFSTLFSKQKTPLVSKNQKRIWYPLAPSCLFAAVCRSTPSLSHTLRHQMTHIKHFHV